MSTIQNAIIQAMNARHMSQAELARRSGVSKSSLSRYIGGDDIPASKLASIANALSVSIDELLGIKSTAYLDAKEYNLLTLYRSMNAEGRARLMEQAEFFVTRHPLNKAVQNTA